MNFINTKSLQITTETSSLTNHATSSTQATSLDQSIRFDQHNPLHLQNSDSPRMKLVNYCFDEIGFGN